MKAIRPVSYTHLVRMMIYSDPSIPDRTQAILRGEYDQVYEKMLKNALTLEAAGCEAIGITCNTAHFFAEMIADKLNIPIIHMIAHTVFHIKRRNPGAKIAILATEGTIKTQLYQRQMEQGEMCIRDRGEAVKMKKFIQRIVDLETGGMKEKDITLTVNCEEDLVFMTNQESLKHILINLIQNAVDAITVTPGRVIITAELIDTCLLYTSRCV